MAVPGLCLALILQVLKRAFRSEIFFARFFPKKVLTNLKTNFAKFQLFYDLPFLRYDNLDFPSKRLIPLKNFARVAN